MVNITLRNKTGKPYGEVRDSICMHLRGNRAYIDSDIIVSDCNEDQNEICFSLGDSPECVNVIGELTEIPEV